jgi:uncharacterized protein
VENNPFIKKFKIDEKFYIYDVNTNCLFNVNELVYNLVDKNDMNLCESNIINKYPLNKIQNANEEIKKMKANGYFSSHRPMITYFHEVPKNRFSEFLKKMLTNNLYRITIVATERCNMRCQYCAYSGKYLYNRPHSKKNMSSKVMKKAVDFYFNNSKENEDKNISIYGGEPLLNFKLIKECVEYIKAEYSENVKYNMTINGTLLNKEIIEFLANNNFSLLISVDGPKKIHDRYRLFKNGKGTFDCIIRNLKMLKSMYTDYYKNKVRFNMVLSPPLDYNAINDFISDSDIKPAGIRFSDVNKRYTSFFDRFSKEQLKRFKEETINFLRGYNIKLARGEELNELEKSMYRMKYSNIHKREMNVLKEKFPANGQCIVGLRSLLVNIDGSFNFCTQVDDVFNLGNVYSGFDYSRIESIYYDLDNLLSKKCYGCWAIRFCMRCIKDLNKNGKVDEDVFENFCIKNKTSILNDIKSYIKIREKNHHAFDHLDEVTIL